jgi:transmembrane sensor
MKEQIISDSINEAIGNYYTNQMTQSQADELLKWVGESAENLRCFHEIGKIWYATSQLSSGETDTLKAWENLLGKIKDNDKRPMPKPEIRIRLSVIYRFAAAVLLLTALGIGSIFVFKLPEQKTEAAYFEALAPKGSRSFITLSDGTTVWLNSGTKLRYQRNFGQERRDLFLEGEAFFVVAENKQIPFRVNTSDICITATGTAFNVKAYDDENIVETTLENGEVRIDAVNTSRNKPEITPVFLKPNQKAVFTKSSKNLRINNDEQKTRLSGNVSRTKTRTISLKIDTLVDTKLTTSWKDSRWIFKSEKLIMLAPILERRYDITITFRDSVLQSYKFTGTLKEESLEQVLMAMCLAAPIRYEISHNKVLFYEDSSQKNKYYKPLKTN